MRLLGFILSLSPLEDFPLLFLPPLKFALKLNLLDDGELVIHHSLAKEHSSFQMYAFRSLILMSTGAPQLEWDRGYLQRACETMLWVWSKKFKGKLGTIGKGQGKRGRPKLSYSTKWRTEALRIRDRRKGSGNKDISWWLLSLTLY